MQEKKNYTTSRFGGIGTRSNKRLRRYQPAAMLRSLCGVGIYNLSLDPLGQFLRFRSMFSNLSLIKSSRWYYVAGAISGFYCAWPRVLC